MKAKFTLALLLGILVIFTSSARATTIRPGSNYGGASYGYADCANGTAGNPCEGSTTASYTDYIDGTPYTVYQFVEGNGTSTPTPDIFDVVDFTNVAVGATVELPVLNTALETGEFVCDSRAGLTSSTVVVDSGVSTLNGLPCTPDSTAGITQGADVEYFTNNGTSPITSLALYTVDGNLNTGAATSTPEPGSLALLGLALIPVALLARRRQRA